MARKAKKAGKRKTAQSLISDRASLIVRIGRENKKRIHWEKELLKEIPTLPFPKLPRLLRHPSPRIKIKAMRRIVELSEFLQPTNSQVKDALSELKYLTKDENEQVRAEAITWRKFLSSPPEKRFSNAKLQALLKANKKNF